MCLLCLARFMRRVALDRFAPLAPRVRHLCAPRRNSLQPRPKLADLSTEHAALLLGPHPPPHADKHILCINKPSGLLSQPDSSGSHTAAEAANVLYGERKIKTVHRLDKLATGCLLLARTPRASSRLAAAFAEQKVSKNYLAVVTGRPLEVGQTKLIAATMQSNWRGYISVVPPTEQDVIRARTDEQEQQQQQPPSGRRKDATSKRRDRRSSRTTLLRWHVLASEGGVSLVVASPRGGFKHQVRAMLAFDGLPIVGDPLYGGAQPADHGAPPRLALHAVTLQCAHPIAGHAPLRLRASVPRDDWHQTVPHSIVAAAEAAVDGAAVDAASPLWEEQPDPEDLEEMRS